MVVVQNQTQSSTMTNGAKKDSEQGSGTLSFSELLRGATSKKAVVLLDAKETSKVGIKEGIKENSKETPKLVSAAKSEKPQSIFALLKGSEELTLKESEKPQMNLNPQLTQKMSIAELKVVINEAKEFLKNKIIAHKSLDKAEIDALPKTLKGLVQVAQKLGIELSKVTLEEVRADKASVKPSVLNTNTSLNASKNTKTQNTQAEQTQELEHSKERQKTEPKTAQTKLSETPLFKAQTKTEISTQEMVNAKSAAVDLKTPKEKAEDTLKLLLRGDKNAKSDSGLTADFSVATAKVLVTPLEPTAIRGLESLLHGNKEEGVVQGKLDGLNVSKADSFEVKINEAKQMVKYLSQDVKNAIEDYKSPFTRVKVQLNPQRFGEIDLTVVQRGKNLHVTLSSNNAAINTLAMNVNDLRTQLATSGINNATLNFSSNSQDGSSGQTQQQNQQQKEEASKEYAYFENQEANEEIVSSLEIVVPSYA